MDYTLPSNPLSETKRIIKNITTLPSIKKYKTRVSKCGLGKSQGTKGVARGMEFDSYWEFAWYIYQTDIQGNIVTRNTKNCFHYTNEDNIRSNFYPDFKMGGQFYEIKGIFRTNDLLKKEATIGLVIFVGPDEMKPIINEVNRRFPDWKDEYMNIKHKTKYGKSSYDI